MQKKTAYTLARLPIGISFLMHGLVRLPKLSAFVHGLVQGFADTMLPYGVVVAVAYVLPFVQLFLGIALLLGIAMRKVAFAGVIYMCVLIIGMGLHENWNAVAIQMFYGLYLCLLYVFAEYNNFNTFTDWIKS